MFLLTITEGATTFWVRGGFRKTDITISISNVAMNLMKNIKSIVVTSVILNLCAKICPGQCSWLSSVMVVHNMIDLELQRVFLMYHNPWAAFMPWFVSLCVIILCGFGVKSAILRDWSMQYWLLEHTSCQSFQFSSLPYHFCHALKLSIPVSISMQWRLSCLSRQHAFVKQVSPFCQPQNTISE